MQHLFKSKIIYEKIQQSKDSLEAAIYGDKITQLFDLLKVCAYNLLKFTENQKTLD